MDREMGVLGDFETFHTQLGIVPENRTKFYIHWVGRFLKSCNYQLENINTQSGFRFAGLISIPLWC